MYNDIDFLLFDALRHAGHVLRAHKPHCDEEGGNSPAAKREIILAILADNGDGMRQNRLASAFRVSPSTLSEMLNRLEADGLIERTADPTDRRATLLTLTERGKKRADEIRERIHRDIAAIFAALTDDEKRQLVALLHKIPDPDAD